MVGEVLDERANAKLDSRKGKGRIMFIDLATFTVVHVAISLAAIASGFVVVFGLVAGKQLPGWTGFFLTTTVLTSATGFGFPIHGLTPGHVVGTLSLILLAVGIYALYQQHLAGSWRVAYVITSALALYLNVFVLIVQSFMKLPALKALAPMGGETITQIATLTAFVAIGVLATLRFRKPQALLA